MRQKRRNCLAQVVRQFLEQEAAPRAKVYILKVARRPQQAVSELRQQIQKLRSSQDE